VDHHLGLFIDAKKSWIRLVERRLCCLVLAFYDAINESLLLELPGGKRELGETSAEAAVREMKEESGVLLQLAPRTTVLHEKTVHSLILRDTPRAVLNHTRYDGTFELFVIKTNREKPLEQRSVLERLRNEYRMDQLSKIQQAEDNLARLESGELDEQLIASFASAAAGSDKGETTTLLEQQLQDLHV
jgi:8-oxo-dGTP pyrophosphatase MutT (NUDIX family)